MDVFLSSDGQFSPLMLRKMDGSTGVRCVVPFSGKFLALDGLILPSLQIPVNKKFI